MATTQRHPLHQAFSTLFREVLDGPPGPDAYVLNPGDVGLLRSLRALPAEAASRQPASGASVAAHVDHLRYGLSLLNRWARGEKNPWADSDWKASWQRQVVDANGWTTLLDALESEARQWASAIDTISDASDVEWAGALASAVHTAYHLGAIRQIAPPAAGPRA